MTPAQHLRAAAALAAISVNLLFWCAPLLAALVLRLLIPGARPGVQRLNARCYRLAVACDDWWLQRVSGATWQSPALQLDPEQACILLANHQSWADIFVLQSAFARRGPVVKFLCKRELALIPVLGLIFVAFDFPMLRRRGRVAGSEAARRQQDRERVRKACAGLTQSPAAMLSFVEGTRFTEAKRRQSASPYQHLLRPRVGGFAAILEALAPMQPPVVDVSIRYARSPRFWAFLGGAAGPVTLIAKAHPWSTLRGVELQAWLAARWQEKDAWLDVTAVPRSPS